MMAERAGRGATLLEVEHLSMRFGGLLAVDDLSFQAQAREITALIGPNGAGKTTVFNCITGFYRPDVGRVTLSTEDGPQYLERLEGFRIARAGVVRTFQNIRLFANMSVLENLLVAQHVHLMRASLFSIAGLLGWRRYRRAEHAAVEFARHWLDETGLIDKADWAAGSLAYGDQRRLEIARAMCARPKLLCLDEPAAGLNARESQALSELLQRLRDREGIALLLIEHDMNVVMQISEHVIVLDYGRKIAQGSPDAVRSDAAVIRAYLGENGTQPLPPEVVVDLHRD